MQAIIKTKRLYLRPFAPTDAPAMYALNNDPEVLKYTGDMPFASIATAQDFIKKYDHYDRHGFGRWSVLLKSTNEFIGWCGLKYNEEYLVDIGFRFFRKEWGKGYATEAAKACLDYGFEALKLEKIIGRADGNNIASHRVLEKIGMDFWKEATSEMGEEWRYYHIQK